MPVISLFENVIAFLAVLTPVVFIHEWGHFWVARKSGVVVDVFSIGFGPSLYSWYDKHGTRWQIASVPLGGYVKMRGDMNPASQASSGAQALPGSLASASLPRRFAIVAAGPIANFLLAIILFAAVYMGSGKAFIPAEVGDVLPESPAATAGLEPGDKILSIGGRTVSGFDDMRGIVLQSPNTPLIFQIERQGQPRAVEVTPEAVYFEPLDTEVGRVGVTSAGGEFRRLGPSEALYYGTVDVYKTGYGMVVGIGRLVTGQSSMNELGGPVRIAEFSGDAARQGIYSFILFTALISLNLGLINLLPVPALDGGHLMMFTCEAVLRRPLPDAVQNILLRAGIFFLLSLMAYVMIFDVIRTLS